MKQGSNHSIPKRIIEFGLDQFLQFTKVTEHDALVTLKDSALQVMLEDYLFHLKKTLSPNSIPPKFASLELFFAMNDKVLNFKKIKKMFPEKIKKSGFEAWTTKDIQEMLLICNTETVDNYLILIQHGSKIGGSSLP